METNPSRTIFIDLETAGLKKSAPIIELAAIAVEAGTYNEIDSVEMKVVFSMQDAEVRSLGVSKFSPTLWERWAIPEADAVQKLAHFLREHATKTFQSKKSPGKSYRLAKLAAHNANFDITRIEHWFKKHNLFCPAMKRGLCTEQKARWFFEDNQGVVPPENYQLGTLVRHLGLEGTPDHTALADVRATVELARVLAEYHRISESRAA